MTETRVPDARTPAPPVDREAGARMWAAYSAEHPDTEDAAADEFVVDRFGDSKALSDRLLGLVLDGAKRATASLVADYAAEGEPLPRLGSHWVACDGGGVPRAVLRTIELRLGRLDSVDDTFWRDEGEGDASRAEWIDGHRRYFARTCAARGDEFTDADDVVFERFSVVWPPEVADRAAAS